MMWVVFVFRNETDKNSERDRELKFKQSKWMKQYINSNTEKKTNAADSFEKDFLKLMINSVYGQAIKNLWKRINVWLVNNEKDFLKPTSRQLISLIKSLLKIMPLFMKLTNQFMLDLLLLN